VSFDERAEKIGEIEGIAAGALSPKDGRARLGELLADEATAIRTLAARAAGRYSYDAELMSELQRLVTFDGEADVRRSAIVSLGQVLFEGDLVSVAQAGPRSDEPSQEQAAEVQGFLEEQADGGARSDAERYAAVEALAVRSSDPALHQRLTDLWTLGGTGAKATVLRCVAAGGDRRFGPLVLEAMKEDEPLLRRLAAKAAGEIGLRRAEKKLCRWVKRERSHVRRAAIHALALLDTHSSREFLIELAEGPDPDAALTSAEALDSSSGLYAFLVEMDKVQAKAKRKSRRKERSGKAAALETSAVESPVLEKESDGSAEAESKTEAAADLETEAAADLEPEAEPSNMSAGNEAEVPDEEAGQGTEAEVCGQPETERDAKGIESLEKKVSGKSSPPELAKKSDMEASEADEQVGEGFTPEALEQAKTALEDDPGPDSESHEGTESDSSA